MTIDVFRPNKQKFNSIPIFYAEVIDLIKIQFLYKISKFCRQMVLQYCYGIFNLSKIKYNQ
jgi:hypothetical protein